VEAEPEIDPATRLSVGVLSAIALVVYASNPDFTTLVGIVAYVVSFSIESIAAIAFPFRRPAIFASSPVAWRVGGVPLISIVGALSLIACLVAEWAYFNDPLFGVNILNGFTLQLTGKDGVITKDTVRFLIALGNGRLRARHLRGLADPPRPARCTARGRVRGDPDRVTGRPDEVAVRGTVDHLTSGSLPSSRRGEP